MAIVITPTKQERNTHHFGLTDGTNSIGLILCDSRGNADPLGVQKNPFPTSSLKIYSGEQTHATMEPPYTPITQEEWLGGMGSEIFETDVSRYLEGWRADTTKAGMLMLGPAECYTTGLRATGQHWPYESANTPGGNIWYNWLGLYANTSIVALQFHAPVDINVRFIYFNARRRGAGTGTTIRVSLHPTTGEGNPGTVLTNGQADVPYDDTLYNRWGDLSSKAVCLDLGANCLLTGGNYYWIKFTYTGAATSADHYEILCAYNEGAGALSAVTSLDGAVWASSLYRPFFRVTQPDATFKAFFFEYKGCLYLIRRKDSGAAPDIFINGDQSVANKGANTHTTTRLYDVNKAAVWGVDQWKGCILKITNGTGMSSLPNYRVISGNGVNYLDVSPAWEVAPDDTTEYSILGANTWTEITGHGITTQVTDVLSVNNAVYFALGDGTDIMRMRRYVSGGAWVNQWAAETGKKAFFLKMEPDSNGGTFIWKGMLGAAKVARATGVDCSGSAAAAALNFEADVIIGDLADRITGLEVYGEPEVLWVLKEGSIYPRTGEGVFSRLPIRELENIRDNQNGWAHLVHNLYFYFSTRNGWQRYYQSSLDNIGPDRDSGLPLERRGNVSHAVGMPGRYYIGLAAGGGSGHISSVLANNGTGYSEIYRTPAGGIQVRRLHVQPLPGEAIERLWVSQGEDVLWLPISLNPMQAPVTGYNTYKFTHECSIITGRMYANLQDVWKFWKSVKIGINNPSDAAYYVMVDYQYDGDDTLQLNQWHCLGNLYGNANTEVALGAGVISHWIRLRIRLLTTWNTLTPQVTSSVVEAITRVPSKYTYTATFRLEDNGPNLLGEPDTQLVDTLLAQIETWTATPLPLTTLAMSRRFDGQRVFIENTPIRPTRVMTDEGREVMVAQLTLIGV